MLYSYGALFLWSFLAATVVPLSSEPPLILLVRSEEIMVVPVLVGTLGNAIGACTTYWISRRAAQALTKPHQASKSRTARLYRRYGQPALLLSWVPILGDGLVVLAGATRLRFWDFCFWMTLGKGLRYLALACAALYFL